MDVQFLIRKLRFITVEPILFLYMMIIFMESNALQELIFIKSCMQLMHPENISQCSYGLRGNLTEAVNEAATWSKYNSCCLFSFTFISTFFVGSWSDKFGRKFPMLIPPIGTVCAAIVNCLLSVFINTHVSYFFVSSVISGITFGSVGIIATTFGYISDFTHEQSRSKRIVILESMLFIGGTVGIYIAGVFLKHVNLNYDLNAFAQLFIFEAVISSCIVAYILYRIPSYVSDDIQLLEAPTSSCSLFSSKHIIDSLNTVFKRRQLGKRSKVLLMLLTLFLIYFGSAVQMTLGFYYVKTLGWNFYQYSNFHAIQFGLEGAALLIGLPIFLNFVNVPDHMFAVIGMISRITGFVVFGLSSNDFMIYSCAVWYMFSEFPVPALRSMLSKTVDADEKGRIFAFTASLQNLCYLLGSFVLSTIFTAFEYKGLSFEVVAGLQGISLLIIIYLYCKRYELITVYEIVRNEDGTTTEVQSVVAATGSVNQ